MPLEDALQKLSDGNRRFADSLVTHPNQSAERRAELTKGQNPFAVIVGCSDSRIPPEIIFDQGLGDLFVVRVAGNIVDDLAIGSVEYALDHLGTRLVMVLGHGKCGAVTAATKGGEAGGHIGSIVAAITPAVEKARLQPGDLVENAIRMNVAFVVRQVKEAKPIISGLVETGEVMVVGAYYNIETGKVEIL
jgi:carbonic anhydrase